MQELIIVRGLPGSGKSHFSQWLIERNAAAAPENGHIDHHEADHFFEAVVSASERGGPGETEYVFDRRLLGAAHDYCYGNTLRSLYKGFSCIVSNTFSTKREVERYVRGVRRSGLPVRIKVVKCVGEYQNVHDVPESAIQRMKDRWEDWPGETVYGG